MIENMNFNEKPFFIGDKLTFKDLEKFRVYGDMYFSDEEYIEELTGSTVTISGFIKRGNTYGILLNEYPESTCFTFEMFLI